jgi:hypothetical protein
VSGLVALLIIASSLPSATEGLAAPEEHAAENMEDTDVHALLFKLK